MADWYNKARSGDHKKTDLKHSQELQKQWPLNGATYYETNLS